MIKTTSPADGTISSIQFPVVGIGASAGGLEAVRQFLQAVPQKSGMAYVFVQHLSPTHESFLPEILQKSAKMPVHQITDNIHLEPDNLYIIPSNKIVTATDGVLKLVPLDDKRHKVKIIDLFFSSLAVIHQSYAVGIVLSGLLNDGTVGLQAIKAYGGITFAQDKATAAFDDMPKNAISTGAVDFVLPPAEIARHLIAINYPFHSNGSSSKPDTDEEIFKQLLTLLKVRRGVDFTFYKTSTLKRRIIRRMALNSIGKPADYLQYLRENKTEQDALYNDMLISVTHFFRDKDSFDLLCTTIFPDLIAHKTENEAIRIWIAGCATGEEAYSIAICLQELMGDKAAAIKIQVFATDISETAIAKARAGIYRPMDLEGLSASRLQQFFTKQQGNYQVAKTIRDMCVFAHHNLLTDPPFSKMDVVSCRNVLIYMEPVLQRKALTTFHYALSENGFLMLGKSESINNSTDLFTTYGSKEKIFSKKGGRGRFMQVASQGSEQNFKDIDKGAQSKTNEKDAFKIADEIILKKYTPAGVLVNESFDVTQFRGKTDTWLTLAAGRASLNLFKMAREGLAFELRNLLHMVKRTNEQACKEKILFQLESRQLYVDIEVIPLTGAATQHFLVLFKNGRTSKPAVPSVDDIDYPEIANDGRDIRIGQLEKELLQARADMLTITEEQEAVYEELQDANQELLSGSEEMQTINEELETSKEELQSTNEEINIVNNELVDRNAQLDSARTYTEGIINTIGDPLIILDKNLKVLKATSGFYAKFKVTEKETEGKYFYELGNQQWDIPALRELLEAILPEKKVVAEYEVAHLFPNIGRKVMRLNARQLEKVNGEQMILLSIDDITDKRKVEDGLAAVEVLFKESKERLKLAVEAAGLGTWDYNPLTGELIWDNRCREMFGLVVADAISYDNFMTLIHPDDREGVQIALAQALKGKKNGEYNQEFRTAETHYKKIKWLSFKGKAYLNAEGVAYRFVGTSLDITVQKIHDEATVALLKQKDDFMSIASHELKTPITTLKASLQLLDKMKDNPSPKMLPVLIDAANKSMDKVNNLIMDLLNVSKLNQGQLHLNKTKFVIATLVDECCQHVRAEGLYKVMTAGDRTLEVFADEDRIEQILINFVNNAIKYAPDSKEIVISIEKIKSGVKVSVTDKGPGISADMLPHLFERYYRVNSSGSQYSGLGLGLYISSEIIKKHDGKIGVDSEIGKGSSFWFTLPLK
ncbi:CheR family methyltransferase [Mucilaginibacter paludis]|uniref:Signal transduction histidine kinase with CheB and CheR activity n=1 Tax=Mucilaginibacter paludis DSM 18603 TaxID=714943 RepID=H1Y1D8_9SPHI|nr:CheR family methyltransferase [Mucilaginibacter paludis]EHQ30272.1 signal transduction histidine kinase with CheB and CheR activity [Mucilaginibacter paludis DSM 18603]